MPTTTIDTILHTYQPYLGAHYEKYRNHVCRVFHNCRHIDPDHNNEEKYAIVAVFHDIGIWTNNTIDYLEPSIVQLDIYLKKTGRGQWLDECNAMINWHHKTSPYTGPFQQTVETFRKSDWIDVSLGFRTFGVNKQHISHNRQQYPNRGFHWFLMKKLLKNLFIHPLRPLPMFKK
jgi:hypothetical protein